MILKKDMREEEFVASFSWDSMTFSCFDPKGEFHTKSMPKRSKPRKENDFNDFLHSIIF